MFQAFTGIPRVIDVDAPVALAAYAAGDAVGVPIEIKGVTKAPGVLAILRSVIVADASNIAPVFTLLFFHKKIAGVADNAAFAASAAELRTLIGRCKVVSGDYSAFAATQAAVINPNLFMRTTDHNSLWLQIVADGANDHVAAGDLKIKLMFEQ